MWIFGHQLPTWLRKSFMLPAKKSGIEYDRSKPTIKTSLCLNIEKARENFGWVPKISLDEGIRKTLEWYRENYK